MRIDIPTVPIISALIMMLLIIGGCRFDSINTLSDVSKISSSSLVSSSILSSSLGLVSSVMAPVLRSSSSALIPVHSSRTLNQESSSIVIISQQLSSEAISVSTLSSYQSIDTTLSSDAPHTSTELKASSGQSTNTSLLSSSEVLSSSLSVPSQNRDSLSSSSSSWLSSSSESVEKIPSPVSSESSASESIPSSTIESSNSSSPTLSSSSVEIIISSSQVAGEFIGYTAISTREQLEAMHNNLKGKFYLINDIVLDTTTWNPIGRVPSSVPDRFEGVFDGNGFEIKNLTATAQWNVKNWGFFMHIGPQGEIRNLKLTGIKVGAEKGAYGVGAIAVNNEGLIEDCYVTGKMGSVQSQHRVSAGVDVNNGTMRRIFIDFSGTFLDGTPHVITARSQSGFIANLNKGLIEESAARGRITTDMSGGIVVGVNDITGVIRNVQSIKLGSSHEVTASGYSGSIVGENRGLIENTLARGGVSTGIAREGRLGGIAGSSSGIIRNSVSAAKVFSYGADLLFMGQICGELTGSGTIVNSYGATDAHMARGSSGTYPVDGEFGLPTTISEINSGSLTLFSLWNFTSVWAHTAHGPRLTFLDVY
ncbi:MAG: hypothetical protein OCC49_03670 [Fibrobacterales bacterium]